ncbi:MAG: SET domain-containing protein [Gemmatimonadota bacterium]
MLRVATRLGQSSIHGIGVFAVEGIPKGVEVWGFSPGFDLDLDPAAIAGFPKHARDWFAHFGYVDYHLERLVVCLDNARFINHSADSNLRSDYGRDRYGPDYAARDIEAGEELTADYAEFERTPRESRSL